MEMENFNNMHFAILHFDEKPDVGIIPAKIDILIKTDMSEIELSALITAIANVKEHADWGESISEFIIPDNWENMYWDERVKLAVNHMSKYVGRFEIVPRLDAYAYVN